MNWFPLLIAFGALTVGCAGGDDTTGQGVDAGPSFRQEGPEPSGPADAGPGADGAEESSDGSQCPDDACTIGEARCEGAGVESCEEDPDNPGCGTWSFQDCDGPGQTCVDGSCQIPTGCIDNDGDGYGSQCDPGPDCDDSDETIHSGATELCDGIDNNCNDEIDEGFELGMPCTVGSGNCQADGFRVCDPDGGTMCDATPDGDPEVCDGEDNDCNGIVDDGGACDLCDSDIFEPNDSESDATDLAPNEPKWGFLCPGDVDWFNLLPENGQDYLIYVTFPEDLSDLLVEGYVDSSNVVTGDTWDRDWEVFSLKGSPNTTFGIEVINREPVETFFRIALVPENQANCGDEDGFVVNQSRATASQLPPEWYSTVYMCYGNLSDWFEMGDLQQGDAVEIRVEGLDFIGTDLDLYLVGDPDGDGVYQEIEQSAGFGDFEQISTTIPADGTYYIEVDNWDGDSGNYEVGWSLN